MPKITTQSLYQDFLNHSSVCERRFEQLEDMVKSIRDNHLEHIREDIQELKIAQARNTEKIVEVFRPIPLCSSSSVNFVMKR